MSYESRERLKQKTPTQLQISQQEWEIVMNNIGDFCLLSDQAIKQRYGENSNEDAEIKKMSDEQFLGFARVLVNQVLIRLGYRKKKSDNDVVASNMEDTYTRQGQEMFADAQRESELLVHTR